MRLQIANLVMISAAVLTVGLGATGWRDGSGPGGRFTEAFACGTAAVITAVRDVHDTAGDWVVGDGRPGPVTTKLRDALMNVQRGRVPDTEGWLHPVAGA